MLTNDLKKFNLPDAPGVYYFLGKKGEILYIGKATSLKDRVKSYFSKDIFLSRGPLIHNMLGEIERVKFTETPSVLEALILEAAEIKKHQPYYNSKEKDDKSYNFVTITKEEFPKVTITRGSGTYGPFPHASELKEALKIIRKIFPYRDKKCNPPAGGRKVPKPCFNAQIGLCPGPCAGWVSKQEYRKTVKHLKMFFEAKKPRLIKSLEKEMQTLAKKQKFEEAEKVKRQIFALDHIQDVALIKQELTTNDRQPTTRVEAYDIAHLSGKEVVGVMTVVTDGELDKSQYRKFKIRKDKNNDTENLKEVLTRRLGHLEWPLPNLIVIDGGVGQINAAKMVLQEEGFDIDIVSVVKDDRHKAREILSQDTRNKIQETMKREILLANSEAHRFAIGYHRRLRGKGFRI